MAYDFDRMIEELARPRAARDPYLDQLLEEYGAPATPPPQPSPTPPPPRTPRPSSDFSTSPEEEKPEEAPMPTRRDVDTTTGQDIGVLLSYVGDGLENAANRLGNRPRAPSGAGRSYRHQVAQSLASRQARADRQYAQDVDTRFKQLAERRAQDKAAAAADQNDPTSQASQRAWAKVNAMRQEYGLAPLDPQYRGQFTAGNAPDWLVTGPQTLAARVQSEQAQEAEKRRQATQAQQAKQMLDALRESGRDVSGVDLSNPDAVKLLSQLWEKQADRAAAEKRARINASAQRQQAQQVSGGVRDAITSIKDSDYYATHPQEAYQALNDLDRGMADPDFHTSPDSQRVVAGTERLRDMLEGRARQVPNHYQIPGRPPPSEKEWQEAKEIADGAGKLRRNMEYLQSKAPAGLTDWLSAQGGRAAQILADPQALENNPTLRQWVQSAEDLNDFKAAAGAVALALKDLEKMGALDKGAQDIADVVSGNPTSMVSMLTGDSARAVREALQRTLANVPSELERRGFRANAAGDGDPGDMEARVKRVWSKLSPEEQAAVRQQLGKPEGWVP